jgi:hypothetical protein
MDIDCRIIDPNPPGMYSTLYLVVFFLLLPLAGLGLHESSQYSTSRSAFLFILTAFSTSDFFQKLEQRSEKHSSCRYSFH